MAFYSNKFADFAVVVPNQTKYEMDNRKQFSESLAVLFSTMVSDQEIKKVRRVLSKIVVREDNILSAGFRMNNGSLLFEIGQHTQNWGGYQEQESTTTHVLVPVFRQKTRLGTIELKFKSLSSEEGFGFLNHAIYKLILIVIILGFFSFLFFILRTLRQVDPSSVVPDRVNAAFDTLSEGVVILDDKEQIVLANTAFSELVKREPGALLGFKLSELNWKVATEDVGEVLYPWLIAMATGESSVGEKLNLKVGSDDMRSMVVNCAPINDSQGNQQGILLTFDDVTELEMQKKQLQTMVSNLELSKNEVQRKNKELHFLATRDPLTDCLNRRSFNEQFNEQFNKARNQDENLCCIMVDIDHFKRVNDNYGHAVGDEVIKLLANILQSSTRDTDIVGRYGGEEFCVVLPGLGIDAAVAVAERIRLRIESESASKFASGPTVAASLGVSSILNQAKDPAALNQQADEALYVAKESGRNRVVIWSLDSESKTASQDEVITESDNKPDNRISISDHSKHGEEINSLRTQIKQLEKTAASFAEQLQREQHYDKLTGLPNQALFYDRIKQALERSDRQGSLTAILIVDFDLFSQANDSFGRTVADEMFVLLTERLVSMFRKTDSIVLFNSVADDTTIYRFDGDELAILLTDLDDRMAIPWLVKRIFDAMNQPVLLEDKQVNVFCKVGISLFPEDAGSPEELISHANTAKSFAKKENNANSCQFFDQEMQEASMQQLTLERDVRRAIKDEEWLLYYQPKMEITTGKIKGVEALIRWNHPDRGILGPYEFIQFAEERNLIVEIGEWVLRTACKQAKIWADNGFDIKVAVNLSPVQLRQENFSNLVLDIIKETQIQPRHLELEVTETMLMDNLETAVNILNRLNCRGICIAIDDFGVGYSSLRYLKQLPINSLKIDRLFIKDIMTDVYDKNIVNTVISMAHGMNLRVIAEGVETQEQFKILKIMSCDELQGYLLSKPIEADCLTELLKGKLELV